ncbi:MAG: archease [Nitrospirae bacterium]|nr:archease [Nitrospirota bacterium]
MLRYEEIDIAGDIGLKVHGSSVEELFANAALGLYSFITDTDDVNGSTTITVDLTEETTERLLIAWLNELIYLFDVDGFVGKTVDIKGLDGTHLRAELRGEPFDLQRHNPGILIKAATYHRLSIERQPQGYCATVICDV